MIDKLVLISNREMLVVYDDRPAIRLYDSNGDILNFAAWFFSATIIRLPDYKRRVESDLEETINQEAA